MEPWTQMEDRTGGGLTEQGLSNEQSTGSEEGLKGS